MSACSTSPPSSVAVYGSNSTQDLGRSLQPLVTPYDTPPSTARPTRYIFTCYTPSASASAALISLQALLCATAPVLEATSAFSPRLLVVNLVRLLISATTFSNRTIKNFLRTYVSGKMIDLGQPGFLDIDAVHIHNHRVIIRLQ